MSNVSTQPTNKLEAALAWASRGFHVFPLQEGGKLPLAGSNGHLDATLDPERIREMFTDALTGGFLNHNIGCSPRDGRHLILDLDEKDGRQGIANYTALGGTIAGLVVRTATGGLHIYTSGHDLRTGAGKIAPGIDTRGADGYVVAPGSTIDGVSYEVIEDSGLLLPVPAFVAERIGTRADRDRSKIAYRHVEDDLPHNVARAVHIAQTHPPAVTGCWHDLGFKLGAELARVAVSPDAAVEIAEQHWVPRGSGFSSRDRFVSDILGGYHTAVKDREHGIHSVDAAAEAFRSLDIALPPEGPAPAATPAAEPPPPPPPPPTTRIRGLTPAECGQVVPAPYLIKGLLARGQVGLVAALPAQGKSCFVPLLAYRLARGEMVFGRRTKPGRVAYFGLEDENGMTGRIDAHRLRFGDAPDFRLFVGVGNLLTSEADKEEIIRIVRVSRPALVVLDTVRAGWRGLSENDSDAMGGVVAFARELVRDVEGELGPAVILVHHTTKAGGQTSAGSGVLEADMDVTMFLAKDPETNVVTVSFGKNRNGESFGQEICFGFESVRIGTDGDGDPITRPVAFEIDPRTIRRRKAFSPTQGAALAILEELLEQGGAEVQVGNGVDWAGVGFDGSRSIPRAAWQAACEFRGLSTATDPADRARVFRKALKDLLAAKVIVQSGEDIFLLKSEIS